MNVLPEDVLCELDVPPQLDEIASTRRFVAGALRSDGASDQLTDDAEMVASELITNAIEQTPGAPVRVSLRRGDEHWTLTVADRGPGGLPPVEQWAAPSGPGVVRGRGLAIVRALSERVEVERRDGWTEVTCFWRLGA